MTIVINSPEKPINDKINTDSKHKKMCSHVLNPIWTSLEIIFQAPHRTFTTPQLLGSQFYSSYLGYTGSHCHNLTGPYSESFNMTAPDALSFYKEILNDVNELFGTKHPKNAIKAFKLIEEENMSYTIMALEVLQERDALEKKIALLKKEIKAVHAEKERELQWRKKVVEEKNADRKEIRRLAQLGTKKLQDNESRMQKLLKNTRNLFDTLECDEKEILGHLANDGSVRIDNITDYLKVIEKKINLLLNMEDELEYDEKMANQTEEVVKSPGVVKAEIIMPEPDRNPDVMNNPPFIEDQYYPEFSTVPATEKEIRDAFLSGELDYHVREGDIEAQVTKQDNVDGIEFLKTRVEHSSVFDEYF